MGRTKRQARLAFNPLPASSPSSATAAKEHGQRSCANVGYEGSQRQSKRRRVVDEDPDDEDAELGLPTPVQSSQFPTSSPRPSRTLRSTQIQLERAAETPPAGSSRKTRARQGRLDFSTHIGVRLEESDKEENTSSASSDDETATMARTKTPARRAVKPRRTLRSTQLDGDNSSEEEVRPPSTKRRISSVIEIEDAQSESSGDDAPELYSSPGRKRARKSNATKSYKEDDFVVLSDDDDDGDVPDPDSLPPRTGRRRLRKSNAIQSTKADEFIIPSDSEEEDAPVRSRKVRRGARKFTDLEREDLDEDLELFQSSPPPATARPPKKADPRREALEALKRRRAGLDNEPSSPSAPITGTNDRQRYSGDTSEEEEAAESEEDQEYEAAAAARRRGALDGEDEGDDFVVEDDEDEPMGVPDDVDLELPIYLTGITRMKPKELFRYAVEWMVQKKLNPAYNQDKEKYDITFQRLDDEVRGLAGSKFTSSAWTRDFTISLQARPDIELIELHGLRAELEMDKCQACNRSGHPATFRIEFSGRPYDPRTLEPLEQDSDEDSNIDGGGDDYDDNSNHSTISREEYDSKGRLVPPATRTYSVGRFCKDNAMTAHALEHWKFQLNCWIVEWLKAEGHLTDSRIVKRDRWDEPRRRKYAKKVVEEMDGCGQIRTLYRQFRDEIDSARERKSGWQRREEREF